MFTSILSCQIIMAHVHIVTDNGLGINLTFEIQNCRQFSKRSISMTGSNKKDLLKTFKAGNAVQSK